jgi:hypothetical protein
MRAGDLDAAAARYHASLQRPRRLVTAAICCTLPLTIWAWVLAQTTNSVRVIWFVMTLTSVLMTMLLVKWEQIRDRWSVQDIVPFAVRTAVTIDTGIDTGYTAGDCEVLGMPPPHGFAAVECVKIIKSATRNTVEVVSTVKGETVLIEWRLGWNKPV